MDLVKRLAVAEQQGRRGALLDILREKALPFETVRMRQGEHWVENIVVPLGERGAGGKRLVLGAHYDSVEGSTGANDNAAAVSILIRLACALRGTERPIDVVFFDREEVEDHGSEAYIQRVGAEKIAAMINLDVCGYGTRVAVYDKGFLGDGRFAWALDGAVLARHNVALPGYLPKGDDRIFDQAQIPNISVGILPEGGRPCSPRSPAGSPPIRIPRKPRSGSTRHLAGWR